MERMAAFVEVSGSRLLPGEQTATLLEAVAELNATPLRLPQSVSRAGAAPVIRYSARRPSTHRDPGHGPPCRSVRIGAS